MRVISGTARGCGLVSPKGLATRPTADRTKESLFNILGDIRGVKFLDLFAGSGSVGIEALSRGAELAVFVDSSKECAEYINKNLIKTKLSNKAEVHIKSDALKTLDRFYLEGLLIEKIRFFDIIFLDPPYERPEEFLTAILRKSLNILDEDGFCVIEWQRDEPSFNFPDLGYVLKDERVYGNARLTFLQPIKRNLGGIHK